MGAFRPTRLSLTDFMAHQDLEVEFRAPVTFVLGRNDSGKSSIVNALEVLAVGRARGVTKSDRGALGRGGKFSIRAECDTERGQMVLAATVSQQTPLVRDIEAAFAQPSVMRILFDGGVWSGMTADERRRLLNDQVAVAEWRYPALPGEIASARLSGGPAVALRKATEARRRYAAMLKEAPAALAPEPIVEVAGKKFDLTSSTCSQFNVSAAIRQKKAALTGLREQLVRCSVSRDQVRQTLEGYRREAEGLPELKAEMDAAAAEKSRLERRASELAVAANAHGIEASRMSVEAKRLEDQAMMAECSECGQSVDEAHRADCRARAQELERAYGAAMAKKREADEAHNAAAKAAGEAAGRLTELRHRYAQARDALQICEEMQAQLSAMPEVASDPDKIRSEIAAKEAEVDLCQQLLAAHDRYAAAHDAHQRAASTTAKWREHADLYAEAEKNLEAFIASGAGDAVKLLEARMGQFLAPFGWSVELDEDLMPRRDGVPFGLNCRSNQMLLLASVQYALAMLTGVRFLAIDDYDALDKPRRDAFRAHLGALAVESECRVLVLSASDSEAPDGLFGSFQLINLNNRRKSA